MGFCPQGRTEVSTFLKYFLMFGTFLHWVSYNTLYTCGDSLRMNISLSLRVRIFHVTVDKTSLN